MYGEKIKDYLDEKGIKYGFVATGVGMPVNTFSAILNEKRKITVEEYFAICSVLEVDPNFFADRVKTK